MGRWLCALFCHPLIERDVRCAWRHCPCGRCAVTDEQWNATFRG